MLGLTRRRHAGVTDVVRPHVLENSETVHTGQSNQNAHVNNGGDCRAVRGNDGSVLVQVLAHHTLSCKQRGNRSGAFAECMPSI